MDRILNLSSDKREQNAREKEERLKEKENAEANGEPPAKKQKSEKRGQNKKRTHTENKVPVSVRYYGVQRKEYFTFLKYVYFRQKSVKHLKEENVLTTIASLVMILKQFGAPESSQI